jgi:hypothetical protein
MATSKTTLKTFFETGKKPTQQEYEQLIDAYVHVDDPLQNILGGLANVNEAQQGVVNDKNMSPFLTKVAIDFQIKDGVASSRDTLKKLNNVLQGSIDNHDNDTTNPHQVSKNQVGLSNIPNATTDDWQTNDSNILATSKSVKSLHTELEIVKLNARVQTKNSGSGSGIMTYQKSKSLAQNTTFQLINSTTVRINHQLGNSLYDVFGYTSNASSTPLLGLYSPIHVLTKTSTYMDIKVTDTFSIVTFVLLDYGLIGGGSAI